MKGLSFPWEPGGLDLLNRINDIIEKNGGRAAFYDVVKHELDYTEYQKDKERAEDIIKITLKRKIPYKEACELIPMPITEFSRKISEYKKLNPIEYGT